MRAWTWDELVSCRCLDKAIADLFFLLRLEFGYPSEQFVQLRHLEAKFGKESFDGRLGRSGFLFQPWNQSSEMRLGSLNIGFERCYLSFCCGLDLRSLGFKGGDMGSNGVVEGRHDGSC